MVESRWGVELAGRCEGVTNRWGGVTRVCYTVLANSTLSWAVSNVMANLATATTRVIMIWRLTISEMFWAEVVLLKKISEHFIDL